MEARYEPYRLFPGHNCPICGRIAACHRRGMADVASGGLGHNPLRSSRRRDSSELSATPCLCVCQMVFRTRFRLDVVIDNRRRKTLSAVAMSSSVDGIPASHTPKTSSNVENQRVSLPFLFAPAALSYSLRDRLSNESYPPEISFSSVFAPTPSMLPSGSPYCMPFLRRCIVIYRIHLSTIPYPNEMLSNTLALVCQIIPYCRPIVGVAFRPNKSTSYKFRQSLPFRATSTFFFISDL